MVAVVGTAGTATGQGRVQISELSSPRAHLCTAVFATLALAQLCVVLALQSAQDADFETASSLHLDRQC